MLLSRRVQWQASRDGGPARGTSHPEQDGGVVIASEPNTPELLAPAGDWDALRAAVANGADAVYFGLQEFNARRRAANFALDTLPEVLGYLHRRNVRGYVAFNTLIFSPELPRAADCIAAMARAGADAVIVQDLGLVRLIGRIAPTLPIHASTQMTQTEPRGIEYLRSFGVRRVILARELSLAEIAKIAGATSIELEVFVHGALCVSYSGRCLASESLFGRSANRGECAQACRLPYQLVVDGAPGTACELGAEAAVNASSHPTRSPPDRDSDAEPSYLLSTKDLAAYDRIADLAKLGVKGFKIEGRLKSAHYVAAATQIYRAAIDAAVAGGPFVLTRERELDLMQSFSRGFTRGFLDGADHQALIHGRFPRSRGIRIGTVAARTRHGLVIEIDRSLARGAPAAPPLKPGDGVVFDEGHPERDEQGGRVYSVKPIRAAGRSRGGTRPAPAAPGADRVELTFGRDDVNLAAVSIGSTVWKTDDPVVRRRLEDSFVRDRIVRRIPLTAHVQARAGEPLRITFLDDAGRETHVASDGPLQEARRHSLTVALLREQLGRLGDTPFELASVSLRGGEGSADLLPVMVPKSVLNDLRRRAVEALMELRTSGARHAIVEPNALDAVRRKGASRALPADAAGQDAGQADAAAFANGAPGASLRLYVLTRNDEQLDAVLAWVRVLPPTLSAAAYADFADAGRYADAVARARAVGVSIALAAPQILMPGEEDLLCRIADLAPDAMLVRNLGSLSLLRHHAPRLALIGDHSLNVANELTVGMLAECGLQRVVPGYDVNWSQLEAMLSHVRAGLFEVVVRQHVPLFHMRHCLFAARLSRGAQCSDCGRPCERHDLALRDRVGMDHPVLTDAAGRNTVFNGEAQSDMRRLPAMLKLGLRHFRIELLRETAAEARALLDSVVQSLPPSCLRRPFLV